MDDVVASTAVDGVVAIASIDDGIGVGVHREHVIAREHGRSRLIKRRAHRYAGGRVQDTRNPRQRQIGHHGVEVDLRRPFTPILTGQANAGIGTREDPPTDISTGIQHKTTVAHGPSGQVSTDSRLGCGHRLNPCEVTADLAWRVGYERALEVNEFTFAVLNPHQIEAGRQSHLTIRQPTAAHTRDNSAFGQCPHGGGNLPRQAVIKLQLCFVGFP